MFHLSVHSNRRCVLKEEIKPMASFIQPNCNRSLDDVEITFDSDYNNHQIKNETYHGQEIKQEYPLPTASSFIHKLDMTNRITHDDADLLNPMNFLNQNLPDHQNSFVSPSRIYENKSAFDSFNHRLPSHPPYQFPPVGVARPYFSSQSTSMYQEPPRSYPSPSSNFQPRLMNPFEEFPNKQNDMRLYYGTSKRPYASQNMGPNKIFMNNSKEIYQGIVSN